MRPRFLAPAIVVVLASCASTAGEASRPTAARRTTPTNAAPAPSGVLILASREGTVSVRTTDGAAAFRAPYGVAAPDSSTIVQSQPVATGTRVVASDPRTGVPRWSHDITGTRKVRVVSPGGRFVALVDGSLPVPSSPRPTTVVDIVTAKGSREVHLLGNLDPEAFSIDGRFLFVLDFLPAAAPTRYSVRRVDLRTLRVAPVPDRDGSVRQPMPGYARTQLLSPDGTQLYTFYASPEPVHDGGETYHAWVHVLNLAGGWAHCVDLDERIGAGGNANPALAVTPDGSRLFVTDGVSHAVAAVDTKTLDVIDTRFEAGLANADQVAVAAADGETLYASDSQGGLATIDAKTLAIDPAKTISVLGVTAVRMNATDQILYLLSAQGLLAVDTHGRVLHTWPSPGDATSIDPAVVVPGRGVYQCAC